MDYVGALCTSACYTLAAGGTFATGMHQKPTCILRELIINTPAEAGELRMTPFYVFPIRHTVFRLLCRRMFCTELSQVLRLLLQHVARQTYTIMHTSAACISTTYTYMHRIFTFACMHQGDEDNIIAIVSEIYGLLSELFNTCSFFIFLCDGCDTTKEKLHSPCSTCVLQT